MLLFIHLRYVVANIILSSTNAWLGTTGAPKGCELTHENAVQAMLAFSRIFEGRWDENSRFLQFASFHFDVSVLEQFWSWSVGICVTSTPRDILFADLALAMRKLGITHADLTPSLATLLHPDQIPSLRRGIFIVGGEALKQDILDAWGPSGVLHNGYVSKELLNQPPKLTEIATAQLRLLLVARCTQRCLVTGSHRISALSSIT